MGYHIGVEPGVHVYVEDVNPGGVKTIVFLHGWPLSHKQFEYQFQALPAMGFRCIGVDWRGFGAADKPFAGYTFDRLSDDLRVVFDTLGLRDATLAGHSTGGAIAIRYMTRHGGHGVSKLALISAAAPRGFTPETANRLLAEISNDRPAMMRGVAEGFFFRHTSEPFAEWFIRLGLDAAAWSTAAVVRMLRDETVGADLPRIRVPTLIVHGVHDAVIPFAQAEEMRAAIPLARLATFPYSGHGPFWEERETFNRLLAEFAAR